MTCDRHLQFWFERFRGRVAIDIIIDNMYMYLGDNFWRCVLQVFNFRRVYFIE